MDFCELGSGLGACACGGSEIGAFEFVSDAVDWAGEAVHDAADVITSIPIIGEVYRAGFEITGIGFVLDIAGGKNVADSVVNNLKSAAAGAGTFAKYGSIVASFVPGIGTGVSAALSAGSALAQGKSLTDSVIAGIRGAIPGGTAIELAGRVSFDIAANMIQGKTVVASTLVAARNSVPGGIAGQKAFDLGVAVFTAKRIQDKAVALAGAPVDPGFHYLTSKEYMALDLTARYYYEKTKADYEKAHGPRSAAVFAAAVEADLMAMTPAEKAKLAANEEYVRVWQMTHDASGHLLPRKRADVLTYGQQLDAFGNAEPLTSPNGLFRFSIGPHGGTLVIYPNATSERIGDQYSPYARPGPTEIVFGGDDPNINVSSGDMQGDGNFVIYAQDGHPLWSTETNGAGSGAFLQLHDDGNLAIHAAIGTILWQTGANMRNAPPEWFALSAADFLAQWNARAALQLQYAACPAGTVYGNEGYGPPEGADCNGVPLVRPVVAPVAAVVAPIHMVALVAAQPIVTASTASKAAMSPGRKVAWSLGGVGAAFALMKLLGGSMR